MFCQNLIKTLYVLVVVYISWIGNSIQNVYNGKFSNANNDFNVTILETKCLLWYFIFNWFLQPAIGYWPFLLDILVRVMIYPLESISG